MQYNPKTVLRQVSNRNLQQFFSPYQEFAALDWAAIRETRIEPVFDAWHRLPEASRKAVSGVLRRVHALASARGTAVLVETAAEEGIDITEAVRSMKNAYDRAFWVSLHHPAVFGGAGTQFHISTLPRRSWEKRNGMPQRAVEVEESVVEELGRNISGYYLARQGRGERCKVEYRRRAGVDTFFAYPADYADEIIGYDDDGELARSPWNPAFEVVFRYDGGAGTMDLYAEGGKKVREDLAEIFARVVLHEERQPMLWERPPFDLDVLKNRDLVFPTQPADEIELVRVTGLRVRVHQRPGGKIGLDVDGGDPGTTVYSLLDATLDEKKVSLSNLTVLEATLQAVFRKPGSRSTTINFRITSGSYCDLGDSAEEEKLKRYLRLWGIERDGKRAA